LPPQNGQPVFTTVRPWTVAAHSWSAAIVLCGARLSPAQSCAVSTESLPARSPKRLILRA
jgi:hypothetical protein